MASDSEGLRHSEPSDVMPPAGVENGFRFGRVTTISLPSPIRKNKKVENGFRFGRVTTFLQLTTTHHSKVENGFRFGRVTTLTPYR